MAKGVPPKELGIQVANQGTIPAEGNLEFLGSSDC